MNHTTYNKKWLSITSKESNYRTRCYTEGNSSTVNHEGTGGLKFLPVNNFCLKKIHLPKNLSINLPNRE